jgi:rsbT co-antagonist protein RsbR
MDATPMTREELAAFDLLRNPLWIVDPAESQRWWVNAAGLRLWNTPSRAEWLGRNAVQQATEATRTRMQSVLRRLAQGETPTERWTLYPDGTPPVVVECKLSGVMITEARGEVGRLAMLVEARTLGDEESNPVERRSYEALRHLSEPVSFYAESGEALLRNPAAIRTFGDPAAPGLLCDQFLASFALPAQAGEARERAEADAVYRADLPARTLTGERWFDTEVRRALDPVSGRPGLLVTQRDVAERRAHVEALEQSRQQIEDQAQALRNLAAPVIRVGAGVLALPLIGALDRERVQVALAALLEHTGAGKVERVVLDLTGAAAVDARAASELLGVIRVLQLQGVAAVLSGIRPALAQAIVAAGLDIGAVPCFKSIEDALRQSR